MIGLALEGGGTKGSYQIGSYYAFKKCKIKIDGIVGTSIGSFNAAMIASGKEQELLDFWTNSNIGEILGLSPSVVAAFNGKEKLNLEVFKSSFSDLKKVLKNKGIDTSSMKKVLDQLIDENILRNNKKDFGLVTVKVNKLTPIEVFKENIPYGQIKSYILASCFLPIFKREKLIDDMYYADGGFYNNCPVDMLVNKGYKKVYGIRINGVGNFKKVTSDKCEVIYINPTRNLSSILSIDSKILIENIKMGYYDTLKVLKRLDGINYYFKPKSNAYYNLITKKINDKDYKQVSKFFGTTNSKDTVIKAIEYVFAKEKINYYEVYSIRECINMIKKNTKIDQFVYNFVKNITIF